MTQPDFPYYNTVDQIYHAEWSTPKLARLELLRQSIRTLWPDGHPTKLIHVAGTGGKGSTCRFLETGLSTIGTAGAFMSPHLFDYRERYSINGEFASRKDITFLWETVVQPHCVQLSLQNSNHTHTFLESSILIALALFEKYEVEWAAIETGVGGRYDQTRALDVVATLLTNVGSDHAHMLGRERWQRTLDKAGIAREGIPFFTSEVDLLNLEVIASVCQHADAPLKIVGQPQVSELDFALERLFDEPTPRNSLLNADYQHWNAALAFSAIKALAPETDDDALVNAFRQTELLGRFWRVDEGVYADIAHNTEKIAALSKEIENRFAGRRRILIVGLSGKRIPIQVFPSLAKVADTIIVTGASFKGQNPEIVRDQIDAIGLAVPTMVIAEPRQAYEIARSLQNADDVVILTGSTYTIEQVLNPDPYLRHLSSTFGWRMEKKTEAKGTLQLELPHGPSPTR
jgi:dihydrofolate synthase/folylpolyglutamate synthase